jgi:aspartate 1-decarboxylase
VAIYRTMVRGKIHRATVTAADLHYIGSITIDATLLEAADILPFERVQVVDVTNGQRLETYTIAGEPGSGTIQLNGAAAHLVNVGDLVIIMAYAQVEEPVPAGWQPTVVLVDERNAITEVRRMRPEGGLTGC